ncbi:phosphonate ABC transporter, permease protein PhnE [Nocardioides sp. YIM 152588]|uniref:phosphonate ABC transporter, permease protein PhnE n=1 Tax=Nocardioides sp. YIM 152588 TaxID=3158259 RepID=UPI0032E4B0D7
MSTLSDLDPRPRTAEPPRTGETLPPAERHRLERTVLWPRGRTLITLPLLIGVLWWSSKGAEFAPTELGEGMVNIGEYLSRLWPPDFSELGTIVRLLIETLQMAIVGTLLGGVLALLVAFAATATLAPRWVYYPARWTMNVIRSIPELVFALMFVSAVGLGPFAGILAMTLASIGSIGKVYAEAMESVDQGPLTALRSVGASPRQVIQFGVLPQAAPLLVSYTLLLFEGNVRGATIFGLVGAGGIGLELTTAMRMYDYGHLSAIVISIIVLVTVIDQCSALIRRRLT